MQTKEFRVRPVVRHVVTEFSTDPTRRISNVNTLGEFDNEAYAEMVKASLEEQSAPREYAIVKLNGQHDLATEVMYRYTLEDAESFVAMRRAEQEDWRIYSRVMPRAC